MKLAHMHIKLICNVNTCKIVIHIHIYTNTGGGKNYNNSGDTTNIETLVNQKTPAHKCSGNQVTTKTLILRLPSNSLKGSPIDIYISGY